MGQAPLGVCQGHLSYACAHLQGSAHVAYTVTCAAVFLQWDCYPLGLAALLLMTVFAQALLALVGGYLMPFTFFT